ncbi:putative urease superfamily metal-dependent hydrolase [Cellulosimicrobium cellulans]|jgi:hypothetical protein|uniref:HEPN domain-containing protein n=1 Tax=Cellulosimicrobium cellulans TaxID=1710 RepID=A0A1Y0HUH4_CELCE|nr:hypothetical protein [Cellulosimicrobium cellulans]ARU51828.1 hypothetical protein CBR64_10345 [Cellulosimicrobium cellulans]MBM7818326.1 putative urease superfamily metal-dependent hydrolase [Cellulosimicrobium cellulans]
MSKATQFAAAAHDVLDLADEAADVADAFVTLAVHAGIAAADVVCCVRLGRYSRSENHQDAVALLTAADGDAARHLSSLLRLKTRAGYSPSSVSSQDAVRAERAMDALVELARGLSAAP